MIRITSVLLGGLIGSIVGILIFAILLPMALNLDSDLMTIYPDPGKPITILEDRGVIEAK